ncbi:MAG: ATP-binding cassette domain-containing protein [Desulfitobacteriaceae bacterium]|nr:ATP-binding cassette domain-containing protein [Desulfitobacteriaceae bacterium]MDI6878988.1 ATP-binding cassette domain-containing protein [Desulfitobacteriaceae bacterium]MDI6916141.1 ATP-binding cassette domain-containing protein [Desulfitobacteriaceae bacterium]
MNHAVLTVEALSHVYPNGFQALKDLNFQVRQGEFVALIGQNGAGKTTLAKHFNGLLRPSSGRIRIYGKETRGQKVSSLARTVGFVFQNPDHQIFHDTVAKEAAFGPRNLGFEEPEVKNRVKAALQAVGLEKRAEDSPQGLSRGERQRLALASVLAMETEIIVLDEPTTGQDQTEALEMMDLLGELNRKGHTILFITHDMALVARYAQRVLVLCEGTLLLDGSVDTVFAQPDVLSRTLVEPPQIIQLASRLGLQHILTPEDLVAELLPRRVAL